MKQCPYCAEQVKAAAVKCGHCGERLEEPDELSGGVGESRRRLEEFAAQIEGIELNDPAEQGAPPASSGPEKDGSGRDQGRASGNRMSRPAKAILAIIVVVTATFSLYLTGSILEFVATAVFSFIFYGVIIFIVDRLIARLRRTSSVE